MNVELPDGTIIEGVPEGTTKAQLADKLRANGRAVPQEWLGDWEGSSNQADKQHPIARTIGNIPGSAKKFAGGLWQAVTSPVQTATGVLDAAAGGLKRLTPAPIERLIDSIDPNPAAAQRAEHTASAVGSMYRDRYGSLGQAANTLMDDPVGAVADLSTVLGAGAMLTPGKAGSALARASSLTNPLTPAIQGAKATAGFAGKHGIGLATQVGPENVAQAYKAGKAADPAFMANLTGKTPFVEVLETAKHGLANMAKERAKQYQASMAGVAGDKTVLDFAGIDKALSDAAAVATYKGQVTNWKAAKAVADMAEEVQRWKALPPSEFHTPAGIDALKKSLNATLESLPFEERTARLAAGKVYNAAKSEISKQAPTYAKTMKDYSEASDLIREIERALSLGQRASADTAMRKLQSLARNNVQTNYGNRLSLAQDLETQGGVSLLPSIAGQAMNTWTARGLGGQVGMGGTVLGTAMLSTPWLAALLLPQSPKAMGALAYGAGRAAGGLGRLGMTPERAAIAGLLGERGSQTQLEKDW